ncbi:putative bolA-like protein [Dirofilaria immitis]
MCGSVSLKGVPCKSSVLIILERLNSNYTMLLNKGAIHTCVAWHGPVKDRIIQRLRTEFKPTHLKVECESRNHAGQVDDERHFYVQIASNNFEALQTVQMHRLINNCLREELAGPVHALRIDAYATSQFSNDSSTTPPKCAQNRT